MTVRWPVTHGVHAASSDPPRGLVARGKQVLLTDQEGHEAGNRTAKAVQHEQPENDVICAERRGETGALHPVYQVDPAKTWWG